MSNFQQPLADNPWPTHLTNRNFRTRFHQQCNYLLGFNAPQKKKKKSIEKKNWPRNNADAKDDPYETLILAYSKEMDQLVEVNIIRNEVDENDYDTCPNGRMTKKKTWCPRHHAQVMDEEEECTKLTTPRTKLNYNDVNNTPRGIGSI